MPFAGNRVVPACWPTRKQDHNGDSNPALLIMLYRPDWVIWEGLAPGFLQDYNPVQTLGFPWSFCSNVPIAFPSRRGLEDRDISWVLVETHGHPVQFFQPSLVGRLGSILLLGSAIIPEHFLEQLWGGSFCSPGCSRLSLCCRQWKRSWAGEGLMENRGLFPFPNE